MNLNELRNHLIKSLKTIDKAIKERNALAYQDIKMYYEDALKSIENNEQPSSQQLRRLTYGVRMMMEAPLSNYQLQKEICEELTKMENFLVDNGY